jgi:O-antigen/teichoic acid export membrane protein
MSQKKRLFHNGIATAIQKGILIAQQLLLVPFFIKVWGAAYYGEWLTLTIIPTIIGFSDLGFGTAAANSFILKYAAGDKQGAANIAKSGFLSIGLIVIVGIFLSGLLIFILDFYHIFDKSLIAKHDAILAVLFLMISRLIGFFTQLYEAHFKAARRASFSMNLQSVNLAVVLIGSLVVLLSGGGIVLFSLTTLIITVAYVITYGVIAHKVLQESKEFKGQVLLADIKAIFHKGFGYLLSPVWQAVFFQGTTFVVRIVLGPVAVTVFNTVRTLTRAVNQANAMVISSVLPELQFEIGAGNLPQARKIFRFGLLIITLIALIGMIFLFFGGPWFYEIWTRKALNPPAMMWNIFIVGILFSGIWWMSSDVLIAANKPYEFTIAGTIVAVIAVLICYFLSIYFGLTGAAVGSFFMDIILFIYVLPQSCKIVKQPLIELVSDIFFDIKVFWFNFKNKLI